MANFYRKEQSMHYYLYLSLFPEALIVSMLDPEKFASYYSVGQEGKATGQAVFIEIDPAFRSTFLPVEEGIARCIPNRDGSLKRSVYISIYRVLEHVPLSFMGDLYYVTRDGRALKVGKQPAMINDDSLHFYHELAPVRPAVVSTLGPLDFKELLMGTRGGFQGMPAAAFVELRLDELATNPENGDIHDLPYENIDHLRTCLSEVKNKDIASKIFDRSNPGVFPYRVVKNGIFICNTAEGMVLYPMPSDAELRDKYHSWWRSANM